MILSCKGSKRITKNNAIRKIRKRRERRFTGGAE